MNYLKGAEKFYDLFGEKDDVEFYVNQAKHFRGKSLELGVGTARLAIKLAEAGFETWGIDKSRYMLNAAKQNVLKLDPVVQSRIHLNIGDALDFKIPERFNLIYFPSCSFDHILSTVEQRSALKNIRRHIAPGGAYVFDLYINTETQYDKNWFIQRKKLNEARYVIRTGYQTADFEDRHMSLNLWYELHENGKMLERYHEGTKVYIHDVGGIRGLLRETGYKIIHEYGDHYGKPFIEGDRMIVIVAQPM